MSQAITFYQRESFVYIVAIIASVLLSAWINTHEAVINVDAICYILSAEALSQFDLHGAMHVCPQAKWPFYSVLIYGLAKITTLSYIAAAYLLDAIFSALSVITFIAIVARTRSLCTGTTNAAPRTQKTCTSYMWLAMFVILASHQFNSVRQYIVRDHGFWAFYLASIYFLLQYVENASWKRALAWNASLLAATLFRIEGAIFLLVLPFVTFFLPTFSWRQRATRFIQLYAPTLIVCVGIALWLLLHPQQTLEKLGRVHEVINQLQNGIALIAERFQDTKQAMSQHVLSYDAARDAGLVLVLTLLIWYVVTVCGNLSWPYTLLVLYAWFTRAASFKRTTLFVLGAYLLINLFITFGFFAQHLFLAKRYLIAFSLVLMVWVPFALDKLWQQTTEKRIWFSIATAAILLSAAVGIISFGYSKNYLHEAGTWVAKNVPEKAAVYVNDYQLMYYTERYRQDFFPTIERYTRTDTLSQGKWKQYDYLALRIGKHDHERQLAFLQKLSLSPAKEFVNERGDKVVIYKVRR
jgi:hypothetical protein